MAIEPDVSGEMVACILVFCAEHGINADSDSVRDWLDAYWVGRFAVLDAEHRIATGVVVSTIVVCEPSSRCGAASCPVCSAH
jgi:hypothetical protein